MSKPLSQVDFEATSAPGSMAWRKKHSRISRRRDEYRLWQARGVEDVSFQRQAQVTWWTVLGGIAIGALLTQVESLFLAIEEGQWYYGLYFLASCLIVINSWVQTTWGSLVLRWQISIPTVLILFMSGLSLSLASLNIMRPLTWFAAVLAVVLASILMQYTFMRSGSQVTLPPEAVRRVRMGLFIYLVFAGVIAAAYLHLRLSPSPATETTWGVFAFLASIFALVWQHLGMKAERQRMGIA